MVLLRPSSNIMIALLSWFRVRIIASVPGAHTGKNMHKWGHMKLRKVSTQDCPRFSVKVVTSTCTLYYDVGDFPLARARCERGKPCTKYFRAFSVEDGDTSDGIRLRIRREDTQGAPDVLLDLSSGSPRASHSRMLWLSLL